jgi:hypothetical protein
VKVTLKVYDILGKEVETHVNEYKVPGIYNSEWKIANGELPNGCTSGVYIYTIKANNFKQSKKMILTK